MKVLLHACCSCCLIIPFEKLKSSGHDVAVYYFNPNIHPSLEYIERFRSVKDYCSNNNIELLVGDYEPERYFKSVVSDLDNRCHKCYALRLSETAEMASGLSFQAITTTLLISIYQDYQKIVETGQKKAEEHNIQFIGDDFRHSFYEAQNRSKELGMYRQKYCGCVFSEKERYAKKLDKIKEGKLE